jgi:Family of unknown function (DUF6529)
MKVVVSTLIGVLAVVQVIGALWIYGKLGLRAELGSVGRGHRINQDARPRRGQAVGGPSGGVMTCATTRPTEVSGSHG